MFKKVLIIILSLFFSLSFAELYFKLKKDSLSLHDNRFVSSEVFRLDPDLIYSWEPGSRVQIKTDEFSENSLINSKGFKGREVSRNSKDKFRIAAVGDSFTYGYGLNYDKTYPYLLESFLNRNIYQNKKSEVLNFGVWGYGIDQEYKQIKTEILDFEPDLIIWNLTLPNDFHDMSPGFAWTMPSLFAMDSENSELIPIDARVNWLYLSNYLYKNLPYLNKIDLFNAFVKAVSTGNLFNRRPDLSYEDTLNWGLKKTVLEIKDIKRETDKNKSGLILVFLPQKELFSENSDPVNRTISDFKSKIKSLNIPLIDVKEILKNSMPEGELTDDLYFAIDGHPNEKGADVIASLVFEFIREENK